MIMKLRDYCLKKIKAKNLGQTETSWSKTGKIATLNADQFTEKIGIQLLHIYEMIIVFSCPRLVYD